MPTGNADDVLFSATLTPHRSLGRAGFLLLMAAIAGLWFATGLYFWALGAWPVIGFVGLDFVAIWVAFRLNYRVARAYEEVVVSRTELVIRKITANGRAQEIRFNPAWVRLQVDDDGEHGATRILVRTRDASVRVGAFLNPKDRRSFAHAFGAALAAARR